jgi:hypothetical protein
VIKLLDNRMRGIFRSLMVTNPRTHQQVPTSLKTGRSLSLDRHIASISNEGRFDALFKEAAKKEFVTKGFAFYSNELAEASLLACRAINLNLSIFGRQVLEPLFINVCRS